MVIPVRGQGGAELRAAPPQSRVERFFTPMKETTFYMLALVGVIGLIAALAFESMGIFFFSCTTIFASTAAAIKSRGRVREQNHTHDIVRAAREIRVATEELEEVVENAGMIALQVEEAGREAH